MLRDGRYIDQDVRGAAYYANIICIEGHAESCTTAGQLYRSDNENRPWWNRQLELTVLNLFRRGCELGAATSCFEAAEAFRTGYGTQVNLTEARTRFRRGCYKDHQPSCAGLLELITGRQSEPMTSSMIGAPLKASCAGRSGEACYELAIAIQREAAEGSARDAGRLLVKGCQLRAREACRAAVSWNGDATVLVTDEERERCRSLQKTAAKDPFLYAAPI
jgi:TPR repeat protein